MQVIGLASMVAFYNVLQTLEKREEKPLVIIVGGLKYTSNTKALWKTYLLEEKYWKTFLNLPLEDSFFFSPKKALVDKTEISSPNKNLTSRMSEEEENSRISSS